MSADREAAIREALDLGLQAWRNTDVRETFHAANDSLNALLAELAAAREREAVAIGRMEDAENDAANARSSRDELLDEACEREAKLREALREISDYEWHPGQPATDVREIARAALAEGEG